MTIGWKDIMREIRCENCGRLLAKEDNGVVNIKTMIKQKIMVTSRAIVFDCPWVYFNHEGRKNCGKQTKFELPEILINV
jgi:hypothetical protein